MIDRSLADTAENWEGMAQEDALFAILTDEQKRGAWSIDEFFATGRSEIDTVLSYLEGVLDAPLRFSGRALDFGCGAGRLTQALGERFARCDGVDISHSMVELGRQYNRHGERCRYHLNQKPDLTLFADGRFDFVYSSIVLQHIPPRHSRGYLRELVRVTAPGGVLVFQQPDYEGRDLTKRLRRRLGLSRSKLAWLHGLIQPTKRRHVMEMYGVSEREIRALLDSPGTELIDVTITNSTQPSFFRGLELGIEAPARGAISKQYVVVKP